MEVRITFSFHAKLKQKVGWFGDNIFKQKRKESQSVRGNEFLIALPK
jgi:hypothetical protein